MADSWTPDIIVGVDFGMTCTGVAYSYGPHWPPPKPIQHWPGLVGSQIATKVPSHILYHPSLPSPKWGFQCEESLSLPDTKEIKQYFKLNLDPDFVDSRPNAPSREQATRYFQDYIAAIYGYVVEYLRKTMPRFEGLRIEFVFSVPTTWKDPRMVEELRGSVRFQREGHRAVIGLTEAEAAAVYVSGLHYQRNDVILVCDAGGGTTDVNVLKLASEPGQPTVYDPLGFVEGKPVGSVFIDLGVHQLLCAKLEPISDVLPGTTEDIAWQMMHGRFERFKCSFGVEGVDLPALRLELPSTVIEPHFPEKGIHNGVILISSEEVRAIFDSKINDLFELLDEQIRRLQLTHPQEKISFLVLSGGFGSCPYVRQRLTQRYESTQHLVPGGIKVLTVDEPQLAVVQGQVMNRTQQLKSHSAPAVFNHLYSPVSYGVICDWLYDPKRHQGEMTRYDERNGKTYAINQIDWLVLQGDLIPRTGISKSFPRKLSPRDLSTPFKTQIVMSRAPRNALPPSMTHPGAQLICSLEVDTAAVEKKPKNHRWYNRAPVYFLVTVIVKLVIEPAGLGFELWNAQGQRIMGNSRAHMAHTLSSPTAERPGISQLHSDSSAASRFSTFSGSTVAGSGSISPTSSERNSGPITVQWEAIAEKMQDENDGQRRLSVPLSSVQMQRDSMVSEMESGVRFELAGDNVLGVHTQTQTQPQGRGLVKAQYFN
ncbi:hypothetical protein BJY04DRAFT_224064 [Aspergillus karnatakaensis]|uniref:Hsp70 family protein n=1 Tax=Aspergillus karnatakaensis TaxID=1810916 RepID=UPI003CCCCEE9